MTVHELRPPPPGCAECGAIRLELDAVMIDRENLQVDLRSARRENQRLRADQTALRRADPNYEVACRLFEFWREQCDHPNSKFGPGRQKPLLARLKEFVPREIAYAILGAKFGAYVDASGTRHDDLELICRDEVHVERFIARYERSQR